MTRPGTACVHAAKGDNGHDALLPPIHQNTTYAWPAVGQQPAYSYARMGNPTLSLLEHRLAALEGGAGAVCFASGIAAIDALLRALDDGSRVVAGTNLYGGTVRLLRTLHAGRLDVAWVDSSDTDALRGVLDRPTALVLLETPSNPTLAVTDLPAAIAAGHAAGALVAVDNTFLTPLGQAPLALGADIVVHSTTKYLDGHNATLGGAVILPAVHAAGPDSLLERLRWVRKSSGSLLAPFEAWLTLQGIKTLHLRFARQCESASRLARLAAAHPAVQRVYYPGLPDHPGHAAHRAQTSHDGAVLAIDVGDQQRAQRLVATLRLFTLAENLGATESLITHPVSMTHGDVPPDVREQLGIRDGLLRLSVGVEETEDLEEALLAALDAVQEVLA